MYQQYYRLSTEPFDLAPDPRFLYLARSHYEALSAMMSGVKERRGVIVVTGEAGIGKTLIIQALLKDFSGKIRTAFVFTPPSDFPSLLQSILRNLGFSFERKRGNADWLMDQFQKFLLERLPRDETVAIVVDEAQNLDPEVLKNLDRLFKTDSPAAKLLQLILVGHPDLELNLNSRKLRAFNKRIALCCRIRPLDSNEGRGYLRYRLKRAGRDFSEIFTTEAGSQIWKFAGGIPRVMNLVGARALDIGYHRSSPIIDSQIIQEAIKDLAYLRQGQRKARRPAGTGGRPPSKTRQVLFFIFSVSVFILSLGLILSFFIRP
jgi:general secretion pathway protein A